MAKGSRFLVSKNLSRNFVANHAPTAEQSAPTRNAPRASAMSWLNKFGNFRTAAAPMIGVASRKLNRAAFSLFNPDNRPPTIDDTDRDIPGLSAAACAVPIPSACFQDRVAISASAWEADGGVSCSRVFAAVAQTL